MIPGALRICIVCDQLTPRNSKGIVFFCFFSILKNYFIYNYNFLPQSFRWYHHKIPVENKALHWPLTLLTPQVLDDSVTEKKIWLRITWKTSRFTSQSHRETGNAHYWLCPLRYVFYVKHLQRIKAGISTEFGVFMAVLCLSWLNVVLYAFGVKFSKRMFVVSSMLNRSVNFF